jgi:hypothetical protein
MGRPTPLPVLSTDCADWIRDIVLRADQVSPILRLCRCEYGACGACLVERHDNCANDRIAGPDTYLLGRHVAVRVWRSGAPCMWRCSCTCQTRKVEAVFNQLDLFADLAVAA